MKIIICLDENNGMAFNRRRQSSDRVIREDMLKMTADYKLYVNSYTAKQFKEDGSRLIVDDSCLDKAEAGDYVFVEDMQIGSYVSAVEQIIVYRWNRKYPADLFFDVDLTSGNWELLHSEEFEGYSHECIGKEIYVRKQEGL